MAILTQAAFGEGLTDSAVKVWMERNGIDPGLVCGYQVTRNSAGESALLLEFRFDDRADTTGPSRIPPTDPGDLPQDYDSASAMHTALDADMCGTFPREMFNDSNARKE